jgi:integrase
MRRYLTDDELAAFMRIARGRRYYVALAMLANLGLRPTEVLSLRRADVHVHEATPWVRVTRLKKRKAVAEHDEVELPASLAALLAEHVGALLPDQQVFAVGRRALLKAFRYYARIAGLPDHLTLYSLRHTAATRLYVKTRDIKLVQAMLGHESADMSTLYAHIPSGLLVSTVQSLPVVV